MRITTFIRVVSTLRKFKKFLKTVYGLTLILVDYLNVSEYITFWSNHFHLIQLEYFSPKTETQIEIQSGRPINYHALHADTFSHFSVKSPIFETKNYFMKHTSLILTNINI
jgi:hypothetical protein